MMRGILFASVLAIAGTVLAGGQQGKSAAVKETVTIATTYDAPTMDPYRTNDVASSNIMKQVYSTLLDPGDDQRYALAEAVEVAGARDFRIRLRQGVLFHNGEELTADDVVFTLRRGGEEQSSFFTSLNRIDPDSFKTEGKYQLSFSLKQSFAPFRDFLSRTYILNRKAVEEGGQDYGLNPVGTGPYRLADWTKNDQMTLTRFADFFGPQPFFATMVVRVIPESSTRVIELEAGTVDLAFELTSLEADRIRENPDLAVTEGETTFVTYLGLNTQQPPLDNVKVRKAIEYALDIRSMTKAVFRGLASPATSALPPSALYFDSSAQVPEYNPERAKQLLAEAGLAEGFTLKLWTNNKKNRIDLATIAKEQLAAVNIGVEIEVLEWALFLDRLQQHQQESFILGWVPSSLDPDNILTAVFQSDGAYNFSRYTGADELLTQSRLLPEGPERRQTFVKLQKKLADEVPWVPLSVRRMAFGHSKNLQSFQVDPALSHRLYLLSWQQ